MKIIKYFRHIKTSDTLPPVPHSYSSEFELKQLPEDVETLMKMSALRSPHNVERLKRRYGVETTAELVDQLPKRHKPRRGERFMPLLRRILGTTAYDPMRRHYLEHRRKGRY
jgi:hypothetical protein